MNLTPKIVSSYKTDVPSEEPTTGGPRLNKVFVNFICEDCVFDEVIFNHVGDDSLYATDNHTVGWYGEEQQQHHESTSTESSAAPISEKAEERAKPLPAILMQLGQVGFVIATTLAVGAAIVGVSSSAAGAGGASSCMSADTAMPDIADIENAVLEFDQSFLRFGPSKSDCDDEEDGVEKNLKDFEKELDEKEMFGWGLSGSGTLKLSVLEKYMELQKAMGDSGTLQSSVSEEHMKFETATSASGTLKLSMSF